MKDLQAIAALYVQIDNYLESLRRPSGAHIGAHDRITDRQRINDQAYFVLAWGQIESEIDAACREAIRRGQAHREWRQRRAWSLYNPDVRRLSGPALCPSGFRRITCGCTVVRGDGAVVRLLVPDDASGTEEGGEGAENRRLPAVPVKPDLADNSGKEHSPEPGAAEAKRGSTRTWGARTAATAQAHDSRPSAAHASPPRSRRSVEPPMSVRTEFERRRPHAYPLRHWYERTHGYAHEDVCEKPCSSHAA